MSDSLHSSSELCLKNLNSLASVDLVSMDEDVNIKATGEPFLLNYPSFQVSLYISVNTRCVGDLGILCVSSSSEGGRLMARYYVAFDTMKEFSKVSGTETLPEMVRIV